MTFKKNIRGNKFGRLKVIKEVGKNKWGHYLWLCKCDCGNEKILNGSELRSGKIKSCGCLVKETTTKIMSTHGFRHTRFYNLWCYMKTRCNNKNVCYYKNYGGRGISVCKKWNKFENFRDDMYESYLEHEKEFGTEQTTLDRVDVNKNYQLNNCRWATWKQQAQNKRKKYVKNLSST